jgi:hypothetical protein
VEQIRFGRAVKLSRDAVEFLVRGVSSLSLLSFFARVLSLMLAGGLTVMLMALRERSWGGLASATPIEALFLWLLLDSVFGVSRARIEGSAVEIRQTFFGIGPRSRVELAAVDGTRVAEHRERQTRYCSVWLAASGSKETVAATCLGSRDAPGNLELSDPIVLLN